MRAKRVPAGLTWVWRLLIAGLLALGGLIAVPSGAATEVIYVSATGHYMRGVFRDYWDRNGGLANFGYPITDEYIDQATGRIYQYYERARFERAQPNSTLVELGLLGRQAIGDRTFPTAEPIASNSQRRYFPETQHIVQYGFKETWETRGGLRIFGYPLSDELDEQLSDGTTHTVQYFERARFEFWPDQPAGQRVLLTLLGRRFVPPQLTAPLAPNAPPAPIGATPTPPPPPPPAATPVPGATPPPLVRPSIPASRNARVTPQAGQPGQVFVLEATGFRPGEEVAVWLNVPDGSVLGADNFRVTADANGALPAGSVGFQSFEDEPTGIWSFVAQGTESKRTAVGYFLVVGSAISRAPEPQPPVPANVDARVDPSAGPAGTIFVFGAGGFRSGEEVDITIKASDGREIGAPFSMRADSGGSITYAGVYYVSTPGEPLGLYTFTAKGRTSGKVSTAYFVLTP
jgi:hypothetical protein